MLLLFSCCPPPLVCDAPPAVNVLLFCTLHHHDHHHHHLADIPPLATSFPYQPYPHRVRRPRPPAGDHHPADTRSSRCRCCKDKFCVGVSCTAASAASAKRGAAAGMFMFNCSCCKPCMRVWLDSLLCLFAVPFYLQQTIACRPCASWSNQFSKLDSAEQTLTPTCASAATPSRCCPPSPTHTHTLQVAGGFADAIYRPLTGGYDPRLLLRCVATHIAAAAGASSSSSGGGRHDSMADGGHLAGLLLLHQVRGEPHNLCTVELRQPSGLAVCKYICVQASRHLLLTRGR